MEIKENWKDVIGYEGRYEVSDLGRVKSLPKTWISGSGTVRSHEGKILKQQEHNGYLSVNLFNNGKGKKHMVHKLIAASFLDDIISDLVVDHIDNNSLNNKVENLQLITQRENLSKDKKGSSKYTGVSWHSQRKKWRSEIYVNGKSKHLGLFTDEYDAHLAYQKALKEML